jgi:hypothetical protein
MSCRIEFFPPLFFVRWAAPSKADLPALNAQLADAHRKLGDPVTYIAIVPEDCEPPNDEMRAAFSDTMDEVLSHCSTMHFVMEGQGFKHSILRNALATVLLVKGQRRKVFVHRTLTEALNASNQHKPPPKRIDVSSMIHRAEVGGIATKPRVASTLKRS